MKRGLSEDVVVRPVPPGQIGVGEDVRVTTLLGSMSAQGSVIATSPHGLTVRENVEGGTVRFYPATVYRFLPVEGDGQQPVVMPVDRSLEDGARGVREANDLASEMGKLAKLDLKKVAKDAPEKDKSAVSKDKLPEDLKKRIGLAGVMDQDMRERVVSEIGDSALASLKRAGVSSTQVFGLVDEVQKAVDDVLMRYSRDDG
jgi:hypothetical protein